MKNKANFSVPILNQTIKRCALFFGSCCTMFSLVFLAQIQEQKRQIQQLQNVKTEHADTVAQLKEENTKMAQELTYKEQLILTYEENGQAIKELTERIQTLQSYYDKGVYLDSLAAELDRENESKSCIERYFKIEKGELEEILRGTAASDQLKGNLPDVYQWECLLPAGDGIWVQYNADAPQNALPMGVVIQNPLIDIGYKDARAGMYIFDIEKNYPDSMVEETEIEETTSVRGIDTHHFHHISYLRYTDDAFIYYYAALDGYGDAAIVYIVPNNGYAAFLKEDVVQNGEGQTDMPQSLVNSVPAVEAGEQEAALSDLEDEWQLLQTKWEIQKLLKEKEADSANSEMIYEKYFRLKQGELARIEGIKSLDECGNFPFLDSHFGGVIFGMDENVWVQYENDILGPIWDYLTPRAILIMDAAPQMGFMGTLAGMNFAQIQENLYETKVKEGFIYNEDGKVYYLQYGDEYYDYIFCSLDEDGSNAWLMIEHAWRDRSGGSALVHQP